VQATQKGCDSASTTLSVTTSAQRRGVPRVPINFTWPLAFASGTSPPAGPWRRGSLTIFDGVNRVAMSRTASLGARPPTLNRTRLSAIDSFANGAATEQTRAREERSTPSLRECDTAEFQTAVAFAAANPGLPQRNGVRLGRGPMRCVRAILSPTFLISSDDAVSTRAGEATTDGVHGNCVVRERMGIKIACALVVGFFLLAAFLP
jgi:hypothetical protein